jgi:inward rectifier potassium channel
MVVVFINKTEKAMWKKWNALHRTSWYHTMIDMNTSKFISYYFNFYITINFIFATFYYIIGLRPCWYYTSGELVVWTVSFFSAQTLLRLDMVTLVLLDFNKCIVFAEALMGLLSFAIATGLFFDVLVSQPFSEIFYHNAIVAPMQAELP